MKNFSNKDIYEIDWAYTDRQKFLRSIPRTWEERRLTQFIFLGAKRHIGTIRQWWAAGKGCIRSIIQKLLASTAIKTVGRHEEMAIQNSTPTRKAH